MSANRSYTELVAKGLGRYVKDHNKRQLHASGSLRTLNSRISPDVAAVVATHCAAVNVPQADLVEALLRAYIADTGISLSSPVPRSG